MSSVPPSPALSGLCVVAATVVVGAAQRCVCVRVIVVVVQPTVWARTGAAQSVDGIVCLFVCSLCFLADLWLVSCVIHEVAGILSVRCMCV